jgi:hypothetical protein
MKTQKQDLAEVFSQIERAAGAVEEVAKGMLAAIKANNASKLEQFNDMVSKAYEANGWSQKAGRPVEGAKEKPAPDAVKLYVSTVRAAYRMGLKVLQFETMGAVRVAIREKRSSASQTVVKPPEMKGIQVSTENSLTGALWHDAVVLWEHLPMTEQQEFEREVRMLMMRFTKNAPAELLQAA